MKGVRIELKKILVDKRFVEEWAIRIYEIGCFSGNGLRGLTKKIMLENNSGCFLLSTLKCLSIGTPNTTTFSICPKRKMMVIRCSNS